MTARFLQGDALAVLPTLPANSFHCTVTSPPYWGLRRYAVPWEGVAPDCNHRLRADPRIATSTLSGSKVTVGHQMEPWPNGICGRCGARAPQEKMIGNENDPEQWVANLVAVFREVRRVLRDDGVLFVNVGDRYAGFGGAGGDYNEGGLKAGASGTGPTASRIKDMNSKQATNAASDTLPRPLPAGYKPKDLMGLPWTLAFALRADGWWLRSEIIWHKVSPMPQSVTDRPTTAHEQLFLLTKQPRYYFDAFAIREGGSPRGWAGSRFDDGATAAVHPDIGKGERNEIPGANARSVQAFAPTPFSVRSLGKYGPLPDVEHYALMPLSMASWCIRAGTSEKGVCPACGAPWMRQLERTKGQPPSFKGSRFDDGVTAAVHPNVGTGERTIVSTTIGWLPSCDHGRAPVKATILDPFAGAGTTMLAAERLGRDSIGIELSGDYIRLAKTRLRDDAPMLTEVAL